MKKIIILFSILINSNCLNAQTNELMKNNKLLPMLENLKLLRKVPNINNYTLNIKSSNVFDTTLWVHLVDSTWGNSMSNADKLNLFNQLWNPINYEYPCFVNLPMYNWDSIVNAMRNEIINGVSEGRFNAIIENLLTYINDGHTYFIDYNNSSYYGTPGYPLFRGESGYFGACVTPLEDSSAMVYDVVPNHPFGLQRGDIILGYNNIPWTKLIKIILRNQIPNEVYVGSSLAATYHRYIQAAGENWHLFDTINIKKCDGTIVNLPTSLMIGHIYAQTFCTEQIPQLGVHKITYTEHSSNHISTSAGVLQGTNIGYVYLLDCSDFSGDSLYTKVKALIEDSLVSGLIIDIRTNFGGGFNAFMKTFEYLNNGNVSWVGYGERSDSLNRYTMINTGLPSWYDINDNDPNYWNNPVAILSGPNAVSAGDFVPVMFKHNPYVRTFGLSTGGAYGACESISISYPGHYAAKQIANFFEVSYPNFYLSHTEYPVDYQMWFNRDSVCEGVDNIVSEAVNWINTTAEMIEDNKAGLSVTVFPNPAKDDVIITLSAKASIEILNINGQIIKSIYSNKGTTTIDLKDLSHGIYIIKVKTDKIIATRKIIKE